MSGTLSAFIMFGAVFAIVTKGRADADDAPLRPESKPWPAGAGFKFESKPNKTRRAASGIACGAAPGTSDRQICLVVFDEGTEARFAEVRDGSIFPLDDRVVLLTPGGGELDAEAAALDGDFFYVTGSHAPKRGDCENNPASRHVLKFRRDAKTGRAAYNADGSLAQYADTQKLWSLMATLPELAQYVGDGVCLGTKPPPKAPHLHGRQGADIEGLAAHDGRLFFGFRGPTIGGRAPVLSVDADALFGTGTPQARVFLLDLEDGRGIRDIQSVPEGFLILAGPGDDPDHDVGWTIALWDGKADTDGKAHPRVLARLQLKDGDGKKVKRDTCDEETKPEGLAVLDRSSTHFRVLVLSDGMCDGGPLSFQIPR
jgi:hypothetical protein